MSPRLVRRSPFRLCRFVLTVAALCGAFPPLAFAQEEEGGGAEPVEASVGETSGASDDAASEEAIVITATRLSDEPYSQPYAFYRHDQEELNQRVGRTALDRLNYGPGVFIQRTAPNQASPFIRGFTGEKTLLLLDGVRYNHAFMRPGPNQYAALIPGSSLQSVDVILGSSSVVNGSDGLTGAIDFNLADAGRGVKTAFSPWLSSRVDVANGATLQGGIDGREGDWAYSIDLMGNDFHDRVGGKDFRTRVFGDQARAYQEIPNTAYEQASAAIRLSYFGVENHRFDIKTGHTRQSDASRPDGYFENTGNASRISRSFDPQDFSYVHLRDVWELDQSWIDTLQTTFWWHRHYEDQRREQVRNSGTPEASYRRREFKNALDALGVDLQATTFFGDDDEHEVTWGATGLFEVTDNDFRELRSPAGSLDPATAVPFEVENWPNRSTVSDGSEYTTLGVFVQDSWDITDEVNLLGGVRFSHYEWSFGNVDGSASDVTGSLRGLWQFLPTQNVFVGFSKAFRAPNLTNLNGASDRGSSGTVAQGNPDLDPELSYTAEAGWRWRKDRDVLGISTFYTFVDDLIQRDFAGGGEFTNVQDAQLIGFEAAFDYGLWFVPMNDDGRLSVVGSASLVDATRDIPQAGGGVRRDNISRANRFYGRLGAKYEYDRSWWGLVQVRWHDTYDDVATDPSDPDSSDLRLTVAGRADGRMPGYGVLDLMLGWQSEDQRRFVTIFAENILDNTQLGMEFVGFFEDRSARRIGELPGGPLLGQLKDLTEYVRKHQVDAIYIALPIRHLQRTQVLLDELQDTTVSLYFVPDVFV
ncbi:MAG: TonB-dependent receptor, partial [Planctomycetota bacterium]